MHGLHNAEKEGLQDCAPLLSERHPKLFLSQKGPWYMTVGGASAVWRLAEGGFRLGVSWPTECCDGCIALAEIIHLLHGSHLLKGLER